MAVAFAVYESATLEVVGSLESLAGAGGKLRFTNKSMNNSKGQLAVVITKKDGTSGVVTCSKAVTAGIRKALEAGISAKKCLASITKLDIVEAPNGGNYVSAPMGEGGVEDFTIAELKKEAVNYEDLVAI